MTTIKLLSIVASGLLMFQCSQPQGGSNEEMPRPHLVIKTVNSDKQEIETGIDAVAGASNDIIVMWYSHPDINRIAKFQIYRSKDPQGLKNYTLIGTNEIINASNQDTTFIDGGNDGLDLYTRYYYYVRAIDGDGNESQPSDTAWYQLMDKAEPTYPNNDVITKPDIKFTFVVPQEAAANGYILRVEYVLGSNASELILLDYVNPFTNFGDSQVIREIQGDSLLTIFPYNNDIYRWRVDLLPGSDVRHSGSESDWKFFTINW